MAKVRRVKPYAWRYWAMCFAVLMVAGIALASEGSDREFAAALGGNVCVGTDDEMAFNGCGSSYSVYYRAVHGIDEPEPYVSGFTTAGNAVMFAAWFLLGVGTILNVTIWVRAKLARRTTPRGSDAQVRAGGTAPPASWVIDPDDPTIMRWWDGQALTIFTRPQD